MLNIKTLALGLYYLLFRGAVKPIFYISTLFPWFILKQKFILPFWYNLWYLNNVLWGGLNSILCGGKYIDYLMSRSRMWCLLALLIKYCLFPSFGQLIQKFSFHRPSVTVWGTIYNQFWSLICGWLKHKCMRHTRALSLFFFLSKQLKFQKVIA